jgi:hypothetical protein
MRGSPAIRARFDRGAARHTGIERVVTGHGAAAHRAFLPFPPAARRSEGRSPCSNEPRPQRRPGLSTRALRTWPAAP